MKAPVMVLHAPGTNRDREVARAFELAGAVATIATMSQLTQDPSPIAAARILVLPGGFSYGDDLGAGRVWALQLAAGTPIGDAVLAHLAAGRTLLGICNGFQALVKAGFLPGAPVAAGGATLTRNAHGRFECRWVTLAPNPRSPAPFIRALREPIRCPIAHGEGRLVFADDAARAAAREAGLGAFVYDENPNGSDDDLAGMTNAQGTVLGLMPHPEDHVVPHQHPDHHRGARDGSGLPLFRAIVAHANDT
ncbi:MAG: phosphoribosylformylglycinamidine synthase subunit PurQ [Myxococcota bacterium]